MSTKRSCYQCGDDDIDAIRAARTEQIRAHAAQVLAEADAKFELEKAEYVPAPSEVDDWEILDNAADEQPVVEPVEIETVEPDALSATDPQEGVENDAVLSEEAEAKAKKDAKTISAAAKKAAAASSKSGDNAK